MAQRRSTRTRSAKPAESENEIRIRETDETRDPEYFHRQDDPYVLPPELNMTVRDGFRFGIGFVLALLVFWTIVGIGVAILVQLGRGILH